MKKLSKCQEKMVPVLNSPISIQKSLTLVTTLIYKASLVILILRHTETGLRKLDTRTKARERIITMRIMTSQGTH